MSRLIIIALLLVIPVVGQQSPQKCNDIVGTWKWFVGPNLTIKPDHTFITSENSGTWEATNPKERQYTLRWDNGGFVDVLTLSPDGRKLTGTNAQQNKVSGERVGDCVDK